MVHDHNIRHMWRPFPAADTMGKSNQMEEWRVCESVTTVYLSAGFSVV